MSVMQKKKNVFTLGTLAITLVNHSSIQIIYKPKGSWHDVLDYLPPSVLLRPVGNNDFLDIYICFLSD